MLAYSLRLITDFRFNLPTRSPQFVAEWFVFLATAAVLLQTLRGHLRSAGPALLLALILPSILARTIAFPRAIGRALTLAIAVCGSFLLYRTPTATVGAWIGWHLLLGGLGFALVDAAPAALTARLRQLFDHMAVYPNGRIAALFACVAVAIPSVGLFTTTAITPFSGDTMPVVATIVRTLKDGTRDLTPYQVEPRAKRWVSYAGQYPPYNMHSSEYAPGLYSAYPAGMEVFAWPGVLLCEALGQDVRDDDVQRRIETRTAAALTAFALALFFLTALHLTGPLAAFLTTAALATGSVFFTTFGQLLWQQGGVAFWSIVILFIEVRSNGKPKLAGAVLQGIACGLMLACRPLSALFLMPFGTWVLLRDGKRGLLVPAVALVAFAPFAVIYWELHRSLTGPSACLYGGLGWPSARNLSGVLFSPGRGLFVYQPLLLLLPLAFLPAFRSDRLRQLGFYPFAFIFMALHCLFISGWIMWWGGHCIGSRLVGEVVPIAALAVAPIVGRLLAMRWGGVLMAVVLLLGFLVHYNAAYHLALNWNVDPVDVDRKTSRLWKWANPPFMYIYREP